MEVAMHEGAVLSGYYLTSANQAQTRKCAFWLQETSFRGQLTPAVTPAVTPVGTPGLTPAVTPVVTPVGTPGLTPAVTPVVTPVGTPGLTPAVTPGLTPGLTPADPQHRSDLPLVPMQQGRPLMLQSMCL